MLCNFCCNSCTVWWIKFGITFGVYTLLLLVPHCMAWLSSWIFLCLPITVIILILLILASVWSWTVDDWILCWLKLFYCCLLGKDGMLSFLNSKWHLRNSWLPCCIVSSRSWFVNNLQKCFLIFSEPGALTFLKIANPSSRYEARFFQIFQIIYGVRNCREVHILLLHQRHPLLR